MLTPNVSHLKTTKNKIKIYQINVNKQTVASALVNREADLNKIDIIAVQEPYSYNNRYGFNGRRILKQSVREQKPLAVTVVKSNVSTIHLPESTNWLVSTKITPLSSVNSFILLNLYLSPSCDILKRLVYVHSILQQYRDTSIVLCGDFNCRSKKFGDVKSNRRGRMLEEFVMNNGLTLINNSSSATFVSTTGTSLIDLMFVNIPAFKELTIENWKLHSSFLTTSDHCLIYCEIALSSITTQLNDSRETNRLEPLGEINYRMLSRSDLSDAFTLTEPVEFTNLDNSETMLRKITLHMQSCITRSNGVRSKSQRESVTIDWWCDELTYLRGLVTASRRKYQASRDKTRADLKSTYLINLRKYRSRIKTEKRNAWHQLCETATLWSRPYSFALGKSKRLSQLDFIEKDGLIISDTSALVDEIRKNFFPIDDTTLDTPQQSDLRRLYTSFEPTTGEHIDEVNSDELRQAFSSLNKRKCPGLDGLTVMALQAFTDIQPTTVLSLLNSVFRGTCFPSDIKKSKVILIEKPHKKGNEITKYRPITLVSSISKIIEHIVLARLITCDGYTRNISNRQYGFVKGKNSLGLNTELMNRIAHFKSLNRHCAIISMDIKGAFDHAWHPQIISQLLRYRIPSYIIQLIASYLADRSIFVNVHDQLHEIKSNRGCPQGSVLGPVLWNLSVNHLLQKTYQNAEVFAYADDFYFLVAVNDQSLIKPTVQQIVTEFSEELNRIKLSLSLNKTHFMILSHRPKYEVITVDNQQITSSTKIDILGIIFDHCLSFRNHLRTQIDKVNLACNFLTSLRTNTRGASFFNLRTLYVACLVPKFSYGSAIWSSVLNKKHWCNQVDSLHRKIAVKVIRSYKNVGYHSSSILLGTVPLRLACLEQAARYISVSNFSTNNRIVANIWNRPQALVHEVHNDIAPQEKFETILEESAIAAAKFRIFVRTISDNDILYSGICKYEHKQFISAKIIKLKYDQSAKEIEQILLIYVLENFTNSNGESHEIIFNNPALIRALRISTAKKSRINKIRRQMTNNNTRITFTTNKKLELVYLKIERSMFANLGEAQLISGYDTRRNINRYIRQRIIDIWNQEYISSQQARQTKFFFPTVTHRLNCNIQLTFVNAQFFTGYGCFRYYECKIGQRENPLCPCSFDSVDDALHRIIDCKFHQLERQVFCGKIGVSRLLSDDLPDIMRNKAKFCAFMELLHDLFRNKSRYRGDPLFIYDDYIHEMVIKMLRSDRDLKRSYAISMGN